MDKIELIQRDSEAFKDMIKQLTITTTKVVMEEIENQDVWLSRKEAMGYLKVKSNDSLLKYRDEPGSPIQYSNPGGPDGNCVYYKPSLHQYLVWKSNKRSGGNSIEESPIKHKRSK